jgi:hypothetical protein
MNRELIDVWPVTAWIAFPNNSATVSTLIFDEGCLSWSVSVTTNSSKTEFSIFS